MVARSGHDSSREIVVLIGIQNGIRLLGAKQELVVEISNINSLSWALVPVVSQDKACQDITVKLKKGKQNRRQMLKNMVFTLCLTRLKW